MPGASHRLTPQEFLDLRPAADRQANLANLGRDLEREVEERTAAALERHELRELEDRLRVGGVREEVAVGGVAHAEPPRAEVSAQRGVSGPLGGLERAEVAREGLHAASLADRP